MSKMAEEEQLICKTRIVEVIENIITDAMLTYCTTAVVTPKGATIPLLTYRSLYPSTIQQGTQNNIIFAFLVYQEQYHNTNEHSHGVQLDQGQSHTIL